MGLEVKDSNRMELFTARFLEQDNKKPMTLDELGELFGASRQTVANWLGGKSYPNAQALAKMAQFYQVSADYLLGLSDTACPDVSARAAVEYTGLSEEAVDWLHRGFDNSSHIGIKVPDEEKRKKLRAASDLIKSAEFREMLDCIITFSEAVYMAELANTLSDLFWDFEGTEQNTGFCFARQENRDDLVAAIVCAQQRGYLFRGEDVKEKMEKMDDEALMRFLADAHFDIKDEKEFRHFQANKAFADYLDACIRRCRRIVFQRE